MARYLVDTCAVIWWLADAPELSRAARRIVSNPRNSILVSVASLWEIAIKTRQRRLAGTEEYLARYQDLHDQWGFSTVLIEGADAVAAGSLAIPHSDPFDRMLIVQARRLEASILTCDEGIRQHADRAVW